MPRDPAMVRPPTIIGRLAAMTPNTKNSTTMTNGTPTVRRAAGPHRWCRSARWPAAAGRPGDVDVEVLGASLTVLPSSPTFLL